jgi:MOSC domain-containing protein YiiM
MMTEARNPATVLSVHLSGKHAFSKGPSGSIRLIENWGVEGDSHAGLTDQHLYHIKRFGHVPNLRQVHLIQAETLDDLNLKGFAVSPGDLGENVCTRNVDLLALPTGTLLRLGPDALIELTGLRNPCVQIENFQSGLLSQLVDRGSTGLVRRCGVMSIVLKGGEVKPGDAVCIELPPLPHPPLAYVVPATTHA